MGTWHKYSDKRPEPKHGNSDGKVRTRYAISGDEYDPEHVNWFPGEGNVLAAESWEWYDTTDEPAPEPQENAVSTQPPSNDEWIPTPGNGWPGQEERFPAEADGVPSRDGRLDVEVTDCSCGVWRALWDAKGFATGEFIAWKRASTPYVRPEPEPPSEPTDDGERREWNNVTEIHFQDGPLMVAEDALEGICVREVLPGDPTVKQVREVVRDLRDYPLDDGERLYIWVCGNKWFAEREKAVEYSKPEMIAVSEFVHVLPGDPSPKQVREVVKELGWLSAYLEDTEGMPRTAKALRDIADKLEGK